MTTAPDTLMDLWDRLSHAGLTLDGLCDKAAALHNVSEYARLDGKREGVRLALSYLEESIRAGGDVPPST